MKNTKYLNICGTFVFAEQIIDKWKKNKIKLWESERERERRKKRIKLCISFGFLFIWFRSNVILIYRHFFAKGKAKKKKQLNIFYWFSFGFISISFVFVPYRPFCLMKTNQQNEAKWTNDFRCQPSFFYVWLTTTELPRDFLFVQFCFWLFYWNESLIAEISKFLKLLCFCTEAKNQTKPTTITQCKWTCKQRIHIHTRIHTNIHIHKRLQSRKRENHVIVVFIVAVVVHVCIFFVAVSFFCLSYSLLSEWTNSIKKTEKQTPHIHPFIYLFIYK